MSTFESNTNKNYSTTALEPTLGDSYRIKILSVLLDAHKHSRDGLVPARDIVRALGVDRDQLQLELQPLADNDIITYERTPNEVWIKLNPDIAAPLRVIQGLNQRGDT